MVAISVRDTKICKICKFSKPIFFSFYNILQPNFVFFLILVRSFQLHWFDCISLSRSKSNLWCKRSIMSQSTPHPSSVCIISFVIATFPFPHTIWRGMLFSTFVPWCTNSGNFSSKGLTTSTFSLTQAAYRGEMPVNWLHCPVAPFFSNIFTISALPFSHALKEKISKSKESYLRYDSAQKLTNDATWLPYTSIYL